MGVFWRETKEIATKYCLRAQDKKIFLADCLNNGITDSDLWKNDKRQVFTKAKNYLWWNGDENISGFSRNMKKILLKILFRTHSGLGQVPLPFPVPIYRKTDL